MSEPYDWTKHWQATRRDGMRVVEVFRRNVGVLAVCAFDTDTNRYDAYEVYLGGNMTCGTDTPRDLLPVAREPVLVPWDQAEFLCAAWGAAFRDKGCFVFESVDWADASGVYFPNDGNVGWLELANGKEYSKDGGYSWKPCGTLEMPQ